MTHWNDPEVEEEQEDVEGNCAEMGCPKCKPRPTWPPTLETKEN